MSPIVGPWLFSFIDITPGIATGSHFPWLDGNLEKTFIFSGANLYNNLPPNLVETNNLQVFTRPAKLHFF